MGGAREGAAGAGGAGGAAAPLAPPAALAGLVAVMVVVPTTAAGSDALEAAGTDAVAEVLSDAVADAIAEAGGEAEASTRRTGIPADSRSTPVPSLPHPHTFSSFTETTTSPARTPIACSN